MLWDRTLGFRRDLRMRTHVNPAAPPPAPSSQGTRGLGSTSRTCCALFGLWGSFPVGPELTDGFVETNPVSCFLEKQPNPRCW